MSQYDGSFPARSSTPTEARGACCQAGRRMTLLTASILLALPVTPRRAEAADVPAKFSVQAQTACEAQMLGNMGAVEVFSGKAYDVLSGVARAFGRPIPHLYVFPGGWNMAYVAASAAVDGRGKIVVGQQAIGLFDAVALKGFFGHELAHLVSDNGAKGCNDYLVRDPQMEADADALAARTLGGDPVKAFLTRVLVITGGQNSEAKHRLALLNETSEISMLKQRD